MTDQIDQPVDIDDGEVLRLINEVRGRMGWEALSAIPTGDPKDACRCVLGRAWAMVVSPVTELPPSAPAGEYNEVILISRAYGPDGTLLEALIDVLGGTATFGRDHTAARAYFDEPLQPAVRLPGSHPLMRWMWQFDHDRRDDLIDLEVEDPIDGDYVHDFMGR